MSKMMLTEPGATRKAGKVIRVLGEYGFISSYDYPTDIYFKMVWLRGPQPLVEGDSVTFILKLFEGNAQAHNLERSGEEPVSAAILRPRGLPEAHSLLQW